MLEHVRVFVFDGHIDLVHFHDQAQHRAPGIHVSLILAVERNLAHLQVQNKAVFLPVIDRCALICSVELLDVLLRLQWHFDLVLLGVTVCLGRVLALNCQAKYI